MRLMPFALVLLLTACGGGGDAYYAQPAEQLPPCAPPCKPPVYLGEGLR